MLTVDPQDPFPPLPADKWLLSVVDRKDDLDTLLWSIPQLVHQESADVDPNRWTPSYSCPAAALRAVQLSLAETGGHVFLLTNNSPDVGYGKIKYSLNKLSTYGTEREFLLYGSLGSVVDKMPSLSASGSGNNAGSATVNTANLNEERATLKEYISLSECCNRCNISVNVILLVESIVKGSLQIGGYVTSIAGGGGSSSAPPLPSSNSHATNTQSNIGRAVSSSTQVMESVDNFAIYSELTRTTGW